ncbi:alpha/beta hydrolase [Botrimarina sp.]|uniref:alpha/beta fold hydrolase n=1 Tax=Botrimarina sp. TaxID=2795802 RepID=UPI0032ED5925
MNAVLLPGLDGSREFRAPFTLAAPPGWAARVVPLPQQRLGYEGLADRLAEEVSGGPCTLIGESFSGPLAILLAERCPETVQRLVLVASFATSPAPKLAAWAPWPLLLRAPLPAAAAKRLLLGEHLHLLPGARVAIAANDPSVLAHRIRCILKVDVTAPLRRLTCPILYLRPTADALVPLRCVQEIQEQNGRVEVHEINAPHMVLQTHPRKAWEAIASR